MKGKKDVSKQTVVVLVFLVILVSILGTFTVLQEAGKVSVSGSQGGTTTDVAKAKITIVNPVDLTDSDTGRATIRIVN